MKHVKLDSESKSVQKFILALGAERVTTVLELNGKPVACLLGASQPDDDPTAEQWTETMNERRCELIDREIDGRLTVEEGLELSRLQDQMLEYRRRVAPLPLDDVRQLHRELLALAASKSS